MNSINIRWLEINSTQRDSPKQQQANTESPEDTHDNKGISEGHLTADQAKRQKSNREYKSQLA